MLVTEGNFMEKLVSIIVPVYNMRQYLQKCVDSLTKQSYKNIEIILVNDGSTDDSGALCDECAKKDARIRVIHKSNGGLSSARNAGLDIARGDYISFVDSDDFLNTATIQKMARCMQTNDCDVVCVKSNIIDSKGNVTHSFSNNTNGVEILKSEQYIKGICEKRLSESVCDKLFTREILENRRFEEGRLNEDFFFLSKLLLGGKSIALIDFAGYNYFKHEGTITSDKKNFTSLKDAIQNSCELIKISKELGKEAEAFFAYSALFQIRVLLIVLPSDKINRNSKDFLFAKEKYYLCSPYFKKVNLKISDKLLLKFFMHFPKSTKFFVDKIRALLK